MQCCLGEVAESTPKIRAFTLISGVADYVIFLTTLDSVIFWLGDDHITCNSDQNISVDHAFSYSG